MLQGLYTQYFAFVLVSTFSSHRFHINATSGAYLHLTIPSFVTLTWFGPTEIYLSSVACQGRMETVRYMSIVHLEVKA